jgi:hypothetical protein
MDGRGRSRSLISAVLAGVVAVWVAARPLAVEPLPDRLDDRTFWRLTEELSEPGGSFRSENLVSNELVFARVLPDLVARARPQGIYLGVGPEQNFTYIAAIRPRLAFVLDIRRGNLQLQLLYKALFELSADRAEFLGRLFSRAMPADLGPSPALPQLLAALANAPAAGEERYRAHLRAVLGHLVITRGFGLSVADLEGIDFVYSSFHRFGPAITWNSSTNGSSGGRATYTELMQQATADGRGLSYLASEEAFGFVKAMQTRNLVVPVVGDFAGPKALRAIGRYLRQHAEVVTAFYLSNVESYLRQDGTWLAFCGNVASLPIDESSLFIRPVGAVLWSSASPAGPSGLSVSVPHPPMTVPLGTPLGRMGDEVRNCPPAGGDSR